MDVNIVASSKAELAEPLSLEHDRRRRFVVISAGLVDLHAPVLLYVHVRILHKRLSRERPPDLALMIMYTVRGNLSTLFCILVFAYQIIIIGFIIPMTPTILSTQPTPITILSTQPHTINNAVNSTRPRGTVPTEPLRA